MVGNLNRTISLIRVLYKSFLFLIFFILFLLLNFIISLLFKNSASRFFYTTKITTFFLKLSLMVFNVSVTVVDETGSIKENKGFLMVSNHVSYLDIFAIASVMNSIFVASVDGIERSFLMGTAAKLGGGIFVERKSKLRIKQDVESMENVLDLGYNVVLFPETTTSNGENVLPFRSSLFASAINARADVVPVCIEYTKLNGVPVDRANRDNVFYYGNAKFFPHLFNMMRQLSIVLEIRFLDKIAYDPRVSRKELCKKTYRQIVEAKIKPDLNQNGETE